MVLNNSSLSLKHAFNYYHDSYFSSGRRESGISAKQLLERFVNRNKH
jgi:hypothetical protein